MIILPKSYITTFLLTALCFSAGSAFADDEVRKLEKEVRIQQSKIQRVQEDIEDHKGLVRESRDKEINLLNQLEKIDQDLARGRKNLQDLKDDLTAQEKLINQKTEELTRVIDEKEKIKDHVRNRLVSFYKMGDIGLMNVTFSASSLPDLLSFKEYFHSLIQYDQKVIEGYREKVLALIAIREELKQGKEEMLKVIVKVKNQESMLSEIRRERMTLLARINTEKKLYQRALEEMEEASEGLTKTLASLREELVETRSKARKKFFSSPKKRRPGSGTDLAQMKGRLVPPVRGSVSTLFGKNSKGRFGLTTFANGIDIKTVSGSEVLAVYDGKVVYSGQLRGYGNLIIIDHGQQYYTLVSRVAELYKKEGEEVKTGEVIGLMNDQGGLLGEGLHFEIRHGTEPQDPLEWLNNSLLKMEAASATSEEESDPTANN
ncbi:MAG: peptidoglycan DD-metalloendopeptidase family protein [Proteobacteria bacterium]|nr:peptidoglycan DD-metalloendopeptidase family protein [Pseudomonadota bacterium]MBU1737318.1 peptidoglycan DD-metalloendopeptidase family protein [Pseudomonadota bacterium]